MIKKVLVMMAFLSVVLIEAKICVRSCYFSAGGYGIGMAWSIPNSQSCTTFPRNGATVYYAYATDGYVFDTGVIDGWDTGMSVGC